MWLTYDLKYWFTQLRNNFITLHMKTKIKTHKSQTKKLLNCVSFPLNHNHHQNNQHHHLYHHTIITNNTTKTTTTSSQPPPPPPLQPPPQNQHHHHHHPPLYKPQNLLILEGCFRGVYVFSLNFWHSVLWLEYFG